MVAGIFGLQAGSLDLDDLHSIAQALLLRSNHSNFAAVGALSTTALEKRREECTALAVYVLSMVDPLEPSEGEFVEASIRFIVDCAPRSMQRWEKHMLLALGDSGKVAMAEVSPYLAAVLQAAEDLCSTPGWLVRRR